MIETIHIVEEQFQYSRSDYADWCAGGWCIGDGGKFDLLLQTTGYLNRKKETYQNQCDHQNYPEVKYAEYLILKKGFPKDGLIYENYALARKVITHNLHKDSLTGIGARSVDDVLSTEFQTEFERLYGLNKHQFTNSKGVAHSLGGTTVDLCAIGALGHSFGLFEIKKYDTVKKHTETVFAHQRFTLAATQYLFATLGQKAVKSPGQFEWFSKFIVFIPDDTTTRIPPLKNAQFELEVG